jgi:hypothetical protein
LRVAPRDSHRGRGRVLVVFIVGVTGGFEVLFDSRVVLVVLVGHSILRDPHLLAVFFKGKVCLLDELEEMKTRAESRKLVFVEVEENVS